MKQLIMVWLMFLSVTSCSSESRHKEQKIQVPYKAEFKGEKMNNSIFGEKPYYKIEIEGRGAKFSVAINGMEVYKYFSTGNAYMNKPINELVTSGNNELQVNIYTQFPQYTINKDAKVNVKLLVSSRSTKKSYELAHIVFDNREKNKIEQSNEELESIVSDNGRYQSEKIVRSSISQELLNGRKGDKGSGVELKQTVNFRTPFPRWKFLDSEEISPTTFDEPSENEAYEKLRHSEKLKGLYEAYQELHDTLDDDNVNAFVDMFSERSAEMEYAYYREKGYNRKGFIRSVNETLDDHNLKLVDFSYTPAENFFALEPNRKVVNLLDQISFNPIKGKGTTRFSMSFRLENGKWILTR